MSSSQPATRTHDRAARRPAAGYLGISPRWVAIATWSALCFPASAVVADEPAPNEAIAARLMASTVTVRVWPESNDARLPGSPPKAVRPESQGLNPFGDPVVIGDPVVKRAPLANRRAAPVAAPSPSAARPAEVIVCTGVVVGPGLVVTSLSPQTLERIAAARFRITEPDGQQSKAAPRVVDHYSNLCLVEIDDARLPPLALSAEPPQVGSAVLTAAGAGIERPIVSRGIVSGVDRSAAGNSLPPLLQCDARSTETSSGAAVVDPQCRALGIVVATTAAADRTGWTFAVPARHVQRLLAARRNGELVTLQRRRPTVGFTLGAGAEPGVVVVERVAAGGPAEAAGIRGGDRLLEADGRKLRSAYQAVDLILARQPGDSLELVTERGGERHQAKITLGGSNVATPGPPAPGGPPGGASPISNQVNVRLVGPGQIEVHRPGEAAALGGDGDPMKKTWAPSRHRSQPAPRDQLGMLEAQIAAFEQVIVKLQAEVRRRDELLSETSELVKALSAEVESLRKQQAAGRDPARSDRPPTESK